MAQTTRRDHMDSRALPIGGQVPHRVLKRAWELAPPIKLSRPFSKSQLLAIVKVTTENRRSHPSLREEVQFRQCNA